MRLDGDLIKDQILLSSVLGNHLDALPYLNKLKLKQ